MDLQSKLTKLESEVNRLKIERIQHLAQINGLKKENSRLQQTLKSQQSDYHLDPLENNELEPIPMNIPNDDSHLPLNNSTPLLLSLPPSQNLNHFPPPLPQQRIILPKPHFIFDKNHSLHYVIARKLFCFPHSKAYKYAPISFFFSFNLFFNLIFFNSFFLK